jgi:chorismate mutase
MRTLNFVYAVLAALFLSSLISAQSVEEQIADALPASYGQLKAKIAELQANLTAQVTAVESSLATVATNVNYVKALTAVGQLPAVENCTTLTCVRDAINTLDDLIMQLYANRLSYAVQAGFIKYEAGEDVLDASREATVIASAEANAVANDLPSYVGSVMYGNYCMLYVSKRLEVETLNAAFNANLTLPVQHAD